MAKRHSDAIAIQGGACNPGAICNSIIAAIKEMRELPGYGTNEWCADPAFRLMVHQLAFLARVDQIENSATLYSELTAACEKESAQ